MRSPASPCMRLNGLAGERRSALPLPEIAPLHLQSLPGPWLGGERSWVEWSDLTGGDSEAGRAISDEGEQSQVPRRIGRASLPGASPGLTRVFRPEARLLIYFTRTAAGLVAHGEGGQPSMDHRDGGNSFPDILASFRNLRWI